MQDLEIKGTGNSRFIKSSVPANTTWEQFLTMLRAGNLPIDLLGLNTAGIITPNPSAYSKANVLPDDVCEELGLDTTTAEPKDAFGVVANVNARPGPGIYASDFWLYITGRHPLLNTGPYNDYGQFFQRNISLTGDAQTITVYDDFLGRFA